MKLLEEHEQLTNQANETIETQILVGLIV